MSHKPNIFKQLLIKSETPNVPRRKITTLTSEFRQALYRMVIPNHLLKILLKNHQVSAGLQVQSHESRQHVIDKATLTQLLNIKIIAPNLKIVHKSGNYTYIQGLTGLHQSGQY